MQKFLLICSSTLLVALFSSWTAVYASHDRTQYHEQGLHGHGSYKFGYHTGDTSHSPMSQHEERDGHGNVKGHYSFVDAHGKHQTVHYHADKKGGFYRSDNPANEHHKKHHEHHHHKPDDHKHHHHDKHHHKHHDKHHHKHHKHHHKHHHFGARA